MSVKKELTTERFVVQDDKKAKTWGELSAAKQRRLAYAWNNMAMAEAGYVQIHHIRDKKAV